MNRKQKSAHRFMKHTNGFLTQTEAEVIYAIRKLYGRYNGVIFPAHICDFYHDTESDYTMAILNLKERGLLSIEKCRYVKPKLSDFYHSAVLPAGCEALGRTK